MAEAAVNAPPTFKLVLVGDGGTGKVCESSYCAPLVGYTMFADQGLMKSPRRLLL